MKKFLAIAMIAASFTACNSGEKTEEVKIDSTTIVATPEVAASVVADTTPAIVADSVSKMAADTTKN